MIEKRDGEHGGAFWYEESLECSLGSSGAGFTAGALYEAATRMEKAALLASAWEAETGCVDGCRFGS